MLGGAQKIILWIFIILLIVIFGIILWTFVEGDIESWPPTSQTCPDFWKETPTGCSNVKNLGSCGKVTRDFSSATPCDKYNWSIGQTVSTITGTTCGTVQWDGINYGFGKYTPCDDGYNPTKL
jgi:hypothetical protein